MIAVAFGSAQAVALGLLRLAKAEVTGGQRAAGCAALAYGHNFGC